MDSNEVTLFAMHHMQASEFANVGAGIGGRFENTKELKVMNYKDAANGPDGVRWQAEVENEYQQMVTNKVFEMVLHKDLPAGTKIIHSVWVMKKKRSTLLGCECERIQAGRRTALRGHNNQLTSHKLSNY